MIFLLRTWVLVSNNVGSNLDSVIYLSVWLRMS